MYLDSDRLACLATREFSSIIVLTAVTLAKVNVDKFYIGDSPTASVALTASPVIWQVAFWAVVALAMNSMAQPGGKFCGFPSRYRRYLSSSPILCLANAISTVLSALLAMLCLKMDPRKACLFAVRARSEVISTEVKEKNDAIIGKVIDERFAKVIVRKIGPTITQLEVIPKKGEPDIQKETFPRWVFFCHGSPSSSNQNCVLCRDPLDEAMGDFICAIIPNHRGGHRVILPIFFHRFEAQCSCLSNSRAQ
jgi:hypothetical protein